MNELTVSITELKTKIENLVVQHQRLKTENDDLNTENTSLKSTIHQQTETITALQLEKQNLIKGKTEEQNKIISDSKQKINELVQEIDNCIALLK